MLHLALVVDGIQTISAKNRLFVRSRGDTFVRWWSDDIVRQNVKPQFIAILRAGSEEQYLIKPLFIHLANDPIRT